MKVLVSLFLLLSSATSFAFDGDEIGGFENPTSERPVSMACKATDTMKDCVVIKLGETYTYSGIGDVTFNKVDEDSRCAIGLQCFWAGQVHIAMHIAAEDGTTHDAIIGLGDNTVSVFPEAESDLEFEVELLDVTPRTLEMLPQDYEVKIALGSRSTM